MSSLTYAADQLNRLLTLHLMPSPWIISQSPYVCETIAVTAAPCEGLRVQVAHEILPASHRLTFFFPHTMVMAHPDNDFEDWVEAMRETLDTSHNQSQWLYDPGTDGMWLNAEVFLQDSTGRRVPHAYSTDLTARDPRSRLGAACLELHRALSIGWGPHDLDQLADKPADTANMPILLKDVAITTKPAPGLLVMLWYERLPGTHWLRIWVPEARVTTPELWDQFPMQLDEDVHTYGHRTQWQFDPETGGMRFTWV